MPNSKSKRKITMRTLCLTLFGLASLNLLSFLSGGEWRNTFVLLGLMIALVLSASFILSARRKQRACNVYTRATVRDITTKGEAIYLTLEYSVMGQITTGTVRYYERELPSRGQDVGLYYSEQCPTDCMLRIYKEHNVGWSKRTRKSYLGNIVTFILFAAFFFAIGIFMVQIYNARLEEYSETASGVVVGYDKQFDSHTVGVPGTYEYSPYVRVEVDGISYLAKSLSLSMLKGYKEGAVIDVHYAPGNPEVVIIDGDTTPHTVVILSTAMGLCFLYVALLEARRFWREHATIGAPVKFI